MPGYEKIESLKNGGSWGQFCWKTCGFERVNVDYFCGVDLVRLYALVCRLNSRLLFIGRF